MGFAWDIQGTGQTLLRGGYGIFNYHDEQGPFAGSLDVPAGVRSTTITRTPSVSGGVLLSDIPNVVPSAARIGVTALDRNDDLQPRTQSWSLTVQRRLPWSLTVETGYIGSKSDRLRNDGIANINTVPFGSLIGQPSANPDDFRPFLLWGDINRVQHNLYSNYHSWQSLVSRQTGRFSFTGSYTFSKTLGIRAGGGTTGKQIYPPDINRLREFAYGTLGNDRRHLFSLAYSWLLPEVKTGVTNAILGNWQLSGISQFITGVPLQLVGGDGNFRISGTNAQGVDLGQRNIVGSTAIQTMPVLTCDPRGSGDVLAKPECFAAPAVGEAGTYVWPSITGPSYVNHDLSVFKNVPVGGNRKFQFRLSAYNVFNHPQRAPEDAINLDLNYTNGTQTNANFGLLPKDNKCRAPDPADGLQVLLLAGLRPGGRPDLPLARERGCSWFSSGPGRRPRRPALRLCSGPRNRSRRCQPRRTIGNDGSCSPAVRARDVCRARGATPGPGRGRRDVLKLFDAAVAAQQTGDLTTAEAQYLRFLEKEPRNLEALVNLGVVYTSMGRFDDAIRLYKTALEISYLSTPVRMNLALAYYKAGRYRRRYPSSRPCSMETPVCITRWC